MIEKFKIKIPFNLILFENYECMNHSGVFFSLGKNFEIIANWNFYDNVSFFDFSHYNNFDIINYNLLINFFYNIKNDYVFFLNRYNFFDFVNINYYFYKFFINNFFNIFNLKNYNKNFISINFKIPINFCFNFKFFFFIGSLFSLFGLFGLQISNYFLFKICHFFFQISNKFLFSLKLYLILYGGYFFYINGKLYQNYIPNFNIFIINTCTLFSLNINFLKKKKTFYNLNFLIFNINNILINNDLFFFKKLIFINNDFFIKYGFLSDKIVLFLKKLEYFNVMAIICLNSIENSFLSIVIIGNNKNFYKIVSFHGFFFEKISSTKNGIINI